MSAITDATIHVHYAHERLMAAIVRPFEFDTARFQRFRPINTDGAGGGKFFCSDLYAGSFNYIAVSDLADWFLALPWGGVDSATLSAEGENNDFVAIAVFQGHRVRVDSECVDAYRDLHRLVVAEAPDVQG